MKTISSKLTLAFLLVAVTAAVLVAVVVRLTSPERLNALLRDQARSQLEALLTDYYSAHGSLDGVETTLESEGYLPPPLHGGGPNQEPGPGPSSRLVFTLADEHGLVLVSMLANFRVGSLLSTETLAGGYPVRSNGRLIATILTPPEPFQLTPVEQAYLNRTGQALWLAAGGASLVALAMGIILARSLARPLRSLTSAAQRMAQGELEQEVRVASRDEIGKLTQAFNQMSRAVSDAHRLRRQMTADVAHDLRTPLTVISGYVESMQDGTLKPTPERLEIIHSEIERLQALVEDLRILSRADAGELALNRQMTAPGPLLERTAAVYQHAAGQKGIALTAEVQDGLPEIFVDEARLAQVLDNVVQNALRYTPAGGSILLNASANERGVRLCVDDTGSGIPAEDLPHVFERFYRADKSRTDAEGASGLGLAIARVLVTAHGGAIRAESAPGRGTKIVIDLPVEQRAGGLQ